MKLYYMIASCLLALMMNSLAEENPYTAGGVPASDHKWRGKDYVTAFNAIRTAKVPLPLVKNEQGKQIIDRMTNLENFSFHRNKTLPLEARFPDFLQMQEANNAILKIYIVRAGKGDKLNTELARLAGYNLHIAAQGIDLLNEFIPTIPKDESYQVRMQGIKKMYRGLTLQFVAIEKSLSETDIYSESDLSILLQAMDQTLPKAKQAFSQSYKKELELKLAARRKQFKGDDLKRIEDMVLELQKDDKIK